MTAGQRAGGQPRGRLSIVATPIGHLQDITLRALTTLREADLILAEDTRHTRKLLTHHAISQKLRALHAHSSPADIEDCLERLEQGLHLALVTDAGTPLVSDPGGKLAALAAERGYEVQSVPGPSAVMAALSSSGLPFDAFRFAGFAPRAGSGRRAWLDAIAGSADASVFFEAPSRLHATLDELCPRLDPARMVAVCRELTKVHEQIVRATAAEIAARFADAVRGEITVVVGAGTVQAQAPVTQVPLTQRIEELLAGGLSARDAARTLAPETGLSRRELYALITREKAAR